MPSAHYLIVDGHSIIFSWDELREVHGTHPARARAELVRALTQYQDWSGTGVVVVFDGAGQRLSSEREEEGIQVIYSDRGRTADDVIERLAASYAGKYQLSVATDDRAEQDTVSSFGAVAIDALALRGLLESSERSLGNFIDGRKRRERLE